MNLNNFFNPGNLFDFSVFLIFVFCIGYLAEVRKRNPFAWMILSMIFSPIGSAMLLAVFEFFDWLERKKDSRSHIIKF